jgi:uncharacterized membrane protein YkoI
MNRSVLQISLLAAALGTALAVAPGQLGWRSFSVAAQTPNPWASVDRTGLANAIAAIEQATGGKVLEIRFQALKGVIGYDAVVAKNGAISHVHIAAALPRKTVVIAEHDRPAWMVNWILKADMKSIQKAKVSLTDAVLSAEKIAGAPAVDAGLAKPLTADNAVLAYNIEVIKDGQPQRIVLDAETGSRIENPDSLLDTWSPEEALYQSLRKT